MTGRPSSYTPELADEICQLMTDGGSLRWICQQDGMPSRETVRRWLDADEAFRGQYARARELQADALADQAVDEAMKATDAGLARLKFDALRWYAGKVAPKAYGDKLQHTGDGGGNVGIVMEIVTGVPRDGDTD